MGLLAIAYWLTLPKKQKLQLLIYGLITAVVALILAKIGAALFYDPRPFIAEHAAPLFAHGDDNGFPSDHTLLSSVIAVAVYLVSKKWGVTLFLLALIVGASRVIAHVHHPIDIVGGVIFAMLGGLVAYYVSPRIIARILK